MAPAANTGKKGKGKATPNKGGGDGGGGGKKFEPVPFINVRTFCHFNESVFITFNALNLIQDRLVIWEKLKQSYLDDLAAKTPVKIEITLPDGKAVEAESWRTTPYDVAKGIR